jgi:hypothetical protein
LIIEILSFISFAVVLMLLIAYFYYRDKGIIRQLEQYELAIDDLSSRLFKVESNSSEEITSIENITHFSKHLKEVEDNLNNKLEDLGDPLLKTIRAIKDMEEKLKVIDQNLNERIGKLEESSKLSTMSNTTKMINEKAIVDLYKAGYSAEEIAKTERTSIGEVELILRIANLR